jgi:hypothetical protein
MPVFNIDIQGHSRTVSFHHHDCDYFCSILPGQAAEENETHADEKKTKITKENRENVRCQSSTETFKDCKLPTKRNCSLR